jgi:hypothetical protein
MRDPASKVQLTIIQQHRLKLQRRTLRSRHSLPSPLKRACRYHERVSFLDNLENNLKALESQEQGGVDDGRKREADRARALAAAPWAEKLKKGAFTQNLMGLATRAGFARRVKVHLVWIGTSLRLEAGNQRLELRPMPDGVKAIFRDGLTETREEPVDLAANPQKLVTAWMEVVDATRKRDEALAQPFEDEED